AKQFWLWAVVWWVVLLGRSTSWGRDYFPDEPRMLFRTISVILIAASIRPRYQANVVVALIRSRNGKGAMVLEGGAFVTRQNSPSCP
ncbi:hypothetical protein MJL81_28125, partial [Salmonella enterica subsp. enterica serovar Anatum]|nr:hypothetical protein [Salmonella enterica subsp. enterica serovar Anatum]